MRGNTTRSGPKIPAVGPFGGGRLFVFDPFGSMDRDCGIHWSRFTGPVNSLDSLV